MTIKISKVPCFGKQIKVWGWTQTVGLSDRATHVAYAYIKEGGYSSKHSHTFLSNRFVVISGTLRIDIWRNDVEETVDLHAGDILDIEPGIFHRMTALSDVQLIEIYWSDQEEFNPEDINRKDNGGLKPKEVYLPTLFQVQEKSEDNYKYKRYLEEHRKNLDSNILKTSDPIPEEMAKVWCDKINNYDGKSCDGY